MQIIQYTWTALLSVAEMCDVFLLFCAISFVTAKDKKETALIFQALYSNYNKSRLFFSSRGKHPRFIGIQDLENQRNFHIQTEKGKAAL